MYFDLFQDKQLSRRQYYQELHAHGSVLRGSAPMPEFAECWYVIGYKEALAVLRSDAFVHDRSKISGSSPLSNFTGAAHQFWESLVEWPLFMDPPQHTEKRLALAQFFREQSIQPLDQFIEMQCETLLEQALRKAEFDLMQDFAYPMALAVTCKVLGIHAPQTDWFKHQARALANAMDFHATAYDYEPANNAVAQLSQYLEKAISNAQENSLCANLANQGMPKKDQISLLIQLLFAGQETSADAIGNLMLVMDKKRELWHGVKTDGSMVDKICKESLRYDTSLQFSGIRTAAQDLQVGNVNLKRGDSVLIVMGACNQDSRHFKQAMDFNYRREHSGPELTFGHGIHYCLGVHLARLELQIALKSLIKLLPDHWSITETAMRRNIVFHGPSRLQISSL